LPLDTYSAMPARRLHTDYTNCSAKAEEFSRNSNRKTIAN